MTAMMGGEENVWESLEERLRPSLIVPQTSLISSLFERMRSLRTHMAVVVDEHGTYIGIVTLEDMLEEIVGEIEDEWDVLDADAPIEKVDSGWRAHGQLPLSELAKTIGVTLGEDIGVSTLGGLIMARLERLPTQGDRLEEDEFELYVAKMDGRRVHTVMISPKRKA